MVEFRGKGTNMKKIGIILLVMVSVLGGCSDGNYKQIPSEKPIIISVNLKENSLTFLEGDTLNEITSWELNVPFTGAMLMPDEDHLAVYGKKMTSVHIYSLIEGELIEEWKVGEGIVNISLINNNKELALVDQVRDSIRIFSLEGKETRSKEVGDQPITLFEDEQNAQLYVVNFDDEKISVLSATSLDLINEIEINPFSTGIMVLSNEKQIWIGGHGKGENMEENVHIFSSETGELIQTLKAPSMPINFLNYDKDVFIVSHGTSTVYKWNSNTSEVASLKVGVNPFEIKQYKDKVLIASYDSNEIHVIHPEEFVIERTVKVGNGPFQIVVRE